MRAATTLRRAWTAADCPRRVAAATGPWSMPRVLRALGALGAAGAVSWWVLRAGPRGPGLPALLAVVGLVALALALLGARERLLGSALLMLGVAVSLPILATGPRLATAATLGTGLVAALELGRWSVDRRVGPPAEGGTELGRWLHLGSVLALGWVVGAGLVAVVAGRLDLAAWVALLGAAAAVAVAGVVVLTARGRSPAGRERR